MNTGEGTIDSTNSEGYDPHGEDYHPNEITEEEIDEVTESIYDRLEVKDDISEVDPPVDIEPSLDTNSLQEDKPLAKQFYQRLD